MNLQSIHQYLLDVTSNSAQQILEGRRYRLSKTVGGVFRIDTKTWAEEKGWRDLWATRARRHDNRGTDTTRAECCSIGPDRTGCEYTCQVLRGSVKGESALGYPRCKPSSHRPGDSQSTRNLSPIGQWNIQNAGLWPYFVDWGG